MNTDRKINRAILLLAIVGACVSSHALASDRQAMHNIQSALNNNDVKAKLDPDIKLYFGAQKHPAVVKKMGEFGTNKKTNAFGKADEVACEWAFLSAVLTLQERARKEGANAVVNIRSNYKGNLTSSETEYLCGAGGLMAGVALKGDFVQLK